MPCSRSCGTGTVAAQIRKGPDWDDGWVGGLPWPTRMAFFARQANVNSGSSIICRAASVVSPIHQHGAPGNYIWDDDGKSLRLACAFA